MDCTPKERLNLSHIAAYREDENLGQDEHMELLE
jgi:hypothetical protein